MKRTKELLVERTRTVLLSSRRTTGWCAECGEAVEMLRPGECALLTGLGALTIYRLIEAGELHYAESSNGLVFVCVRSLFKAVDAHSDFQIIDSPS